MFIRQLVLFSSSTLTILRFNSGSPHVAMVGNVSSGQLLKLETNWIRCIARCFPKLKKIGKSCKRYTILK